MWRDPEAEAFPLPEAEALPEPEAEALPLPEAEAEAEALPLPEAEAEALAVLLPGPEALQFTEAAEEPLLESDSRVPEPELETWQLALAPPLPLPWLRLTP